MVLAVAVTLTLGVWLVMVSLGVVTPVIVVRLVVMAPVPVVVVIAGRGLELSVGQMGRDIHSLAHSLTEASAKAVTKTLPEAVIQGREVHEGITGGALQLGVHPVVRDKQNLGAIYNTGQMLHK